MPTDMYDEIGFAILNPLSLKTIWNLKVLLFQNPALLELSLLYNDKLPEGNFIDNKIP